MALDETDVGPEAHRMAYHVRREVKGQAGRLRMIAQDPSYSLHSRIFRPATSSVVTNSRNFNVTCSNKKGTRYAGASKR
jgi:hypothetical protein